MGVEGSERREEEGRGGERSERGEGRGRERREEEDEGLTRFMSSCSPSRRKARNS